MKSGPKKGIRITERDRLRFEAMARLEGELRDQGYQLIAGVDEAGRGPLAGPVVAAACILPQEPALYGLNDSKKMTVRRREVLYGSIRDQALAWSIAMVDQEEIDRTNILLATREAMRRALRELSRQPQIALIDAVALEGLAYPVLAKTKGDALHNVIAAASILAKVARDRLMVNWDKVYPQYGFAAHKGYGTPQHMEALREHGPCPIHRRSFLGSIRKGKPGPSSYAKGWRTEWAVAEDLIAKGHTLLEHRLRIEGAGEIDFISCRDDRVYVIECKGRGPGSLSFGGLDQALTSDQVRGIRRAAEAWREGQEAFNTHSLEFLYAAVDLDREGSPQDVRYIPF